MGRVRVHLLPERVRPQELAGGSCVVIDVLRATTTIVAALANGARGVVPCQSIDEAKARAAAVGTGAVLAGERGGLRIAGFALGNSPAEYTSAAVSGQTVVLTTTNGTRALVHARLAAEVFVGALVNLSAVVAALTGRQNIDLLCAGTDGQVTEEDVLAAGAIVERLTTLNVHELSGNASAARDAWRAVARADDARGALIAALRASAGGRNLVAIGMEGDIALAAELDCYPLAPRYDPASGLITVESP
jgi:2-phosphosulfolactate phosphatase